MLLRGWCYFNGNHTILSIHFMRKIPLRIHTTIIFASSFQSLSLHLSSFTIPIFPLFSAPTSHNPTPIPTPKITLTSHNIAAPPRLPIPIPAAIRKSHADGSTAGCTWQLSFRTMVTGRFLDVGCSVTGVRGRERGGGKVLMWEP
jgi:hypothetical protein